MEAEFLLQHREFSQILADKRTRLDVRWAERVESDSGERRARVDQLETWGTNQNCGESFGTNTNIQPVPSSARIDPPTLLTTVMAVFYKRNDVGVSRPAYGTASELLTEHTSLECCLGLGRLAGRIGRAGFGR